MRELTEINRMYNKKMEGFHLEIIKDHPLVYQCLVQDDEDVGGEEVTPEK